MASAGGGRGRGSASSLSPLCTVNELKVEGTWITCCLPFVLLQGVQRGEGGQQT